MSRDSSISPALGDNVRDEAADWVVRLHEEDGDPTQRQAEFEAWQAQDPRHGQVFSQMQRMWQAVQPQPRRRSRGAPLLGLLLALGMGLLMPWSDWTADHRTGAGEIARIALPDGSVLVLDGRSSADVVYGPQWRSIELHRGRAWVEVHRDSRPFRIMTPQGDATALGTRYSVRLDGDHADVAVEESSVRVMPRRAPHRAITLSAGHQARLTDADAVPTGTVKLSDFAWTERRLVFVDSPLSDVVEALAVYRPGLLILGSDPALQSLRFTGVLPTDDPQAALKLLAESLSLRSHQFTPYLAWITPQQS